MMKMFTIVKNVVSKETNFNIKQESIFYVPLKTPSARKPPQCEIADQAPISFHSASILSNIIQISLFVS